MGSLAVLTGGQVATGLTAMPSSGAPCGAGEAGCIITSGFSEV